MGGGGEGGLWGCEKGLWGVCGVKGVYVATGAALRALMESLLGAKIRQFSACSFLQCVLRNDVFSALK